MLALGTQHARCGPNTDATAAPCRGMSTSSTRAAWDRAWPRTRWAVGGRRVTARGAAEEHWAAAVVVRVAAGVALVGVELDVQPRLWSRASACSVGKDVSNTI